jgi:hypothetical protein
LNGDYDLLRTRIENADFLSIPHDIATHFSLTLADSNLTDPELGRHIGDKNQRGCDDSDIPLPIVSAIFEMVV